MPPSWPLEVGKIAMIDAELGGQSWQIWNSQRWRETAEVMRQLLEQVAQDPLTHPPPWYPAIVGKSAPEDVGAAAMVMNLYQRANELQLRPLPGLLRRRPGGGGTVDGGAAL